MKSKSLFTKLVAFMLCVIMAISCLPVSAFAAENDWEGDIDVVETEPPAPGSSAENPATIEWEWDADYTIATATVTVPAGTTMYFADNGINADMVLTANGEKVAVTYGSMMMRTPSTFTLTAGEEDVVYNLVLTFAEGSYNNPAVAVLGNNTAEIAAGGQGYIFKYNVEEDGYLAVTVSADTGWTYSVNNLTAGKYGDTQWSDSDPIVNPTKIAVSAGDDIQITVNTYDPANPWSAPAGNVTVNLAYFEPELNNFVSSVSVALDNNIALRFVIDPDLNDDGVLELQGNDNVAVFYKFDEAASEWVEAGRVRQADWESYTKNRFTAAFDIAAKQMTDEVKVVIFTAGGVPLSNEYTDSARDYGMRGVNSLYPKASSNAKTARQLTMFVDFLNYGAAAQTQFTYNTGDLANAQLTDEHQAYATEKAEAENLRTGHGSSQVSVEARIELSFLLDQALVTEDMYVVISYEHHNNVSESVTIQGADFDTYTKNRWKVLAPNIATPDGNQLITCIVYDADGNEVTRAQDSVNSYMARVLASSSAKQPLKDLATAAVKLTTSAYNYLHA